MIAISFATFGTTFSVPFELSNKSTDTVEIVIHGVNKATLLPKAVYNLNLKKGQRIFFKYNGTQYTLLTVSEKMEGKKLDICKLIEARKKQIDSTYISR